MNLICISASNILHQTSKNSTSYRICDAIINAMHNEFIGTTGRIIELKKKCIYPCIGCGKCYSTRRCAFDDDFNAIYDELVAADVIVITSPHYAPIPTKLSALLEKMEQITFLHWGMNNAYKSEMFGKLAGIISHGGGGTWALKSYKAMVNDTIANALDTIQLKIVPFNDEWNTGLSLPVEKVSFNEDDIFPHQAYDWDFIALQILKYVRQIIKLHTCAN